MEQNYVTFAPGIGTMQMWVGLCDGDEAIWQITSDSWHDSIVRSFVTRVDIS